MRSVPSISATVGRAYRVDGREMFAEKARRLLAIAEGELAAGRLADSFEHAYQAALRTAGAAQSGRPRPRRYLRGAWERLASLGGREASWAKEFQGYSRLRARVIAGLDSELSVGLVGGFLALVADFLEEVAPDSAGARVAA